MLVELSISENYVSSWGLQEGYREFLQNVIDASTDGKEYIQWYDSNKKIIRITTKDVGISQSTLLLGESSKQGDSSKIGEKGEGYKIGSLALLRLGKKVVIKNGMENQKWEASIIDSKKYGKKVLAFNIKKYNYKHMLNIFLILFCLVSCSKSSYNRNEAELKNPWLPYRPEISIDPWTPGLETADMDCDKKNNISFDNFLLQDKIYSTDRQDPVPEPQTWMMLAGGLGVLFFIRKRKND